MRAVQFSRFGGPDVLDIVDAPIPSIAGTSSALVRIKACSINPSDVKNVAGAMSQTVPPRIPGRDYAGIVEQGPSEWLGAEVWGTGGDVGFTRDGTHAEYIAVPIESLRHKPAGLGFQEAAALGVNFLTAWCGLMEAGNLQAGETVVIIGASGGVGNAATQIAAHRDAHIIGVERVEPHPNSPARTMTQHLIVGAPDVTAAVREATAGRGADVVFDLVGGAMLPAALNCLAHRGRVVEITAGNQRMVTFDIADFYHNESVLLGVDTLKRDLVASAHVLDKMTTGFDAGAYRPQRIAAEMPLDEAREAYRRVAQGSDGRIVLIP